MDVVVEVQDDKTVTLKDARANRREILKEARGQFADTDASTAGLFANRRWEFEKEEAERPRALDSPLFGPNGLIEVVGVSEEQAKWAASIKEQTRPARLSLGDRLCLALAHETHQDAVTADQAWDKVHVGVSVIQIRRPTGRHP